MAKKPKDTDFVFASLRIKCLETRLLGPADADRILDARETEDVLKILSDRGFETPGDAAGASAAYDAVLKAEAAKNAETLASFGEVDFLTRLFQFQHDYHNLKVCLKGEFSEKPSGPLLVDSGTVDAKKIASAVTERDFSGLTLLMAQGAKEAVDAFSQTNDAQNIDIILDNYCLLEMKAAAKGTRVRFVLDYIDTKIDLLNLQAFFRLKKMEKPREFAKKVIFTGGHLSEKVFTDNFDLSVGEFVGLPALSRYGGLARAAAESYDAPGGMAAIGLLCEDFLEEKVSAAIKIPFGPEVIAGYAIRKENELQTLRVLLSGKAAGLPPEDIKRRLRRSYV